MSGGREGASLYAGKKTLSEGGNVPIYQNMNIPPH
jgi:hypothetical protein